MKKLYLYLFSTLFILFSCSKKNVPFYSTYNYGKYSIETLDSNLTMKDSAWITIKVHDLESKNEIMNTLFITYGCDKVSLNGDLYSIKVSDYNAPIPIRVGSVGYLNIETMPFKAVSNDSIVLNFYLALDKRPILDCLDTN